MKFKDEDVSKPARYAWFLAALIVVGTICYPLGGWLGAIAITGTGILGGICVRLYARLLKKWDLESERKYGSFGHLPDDGPQSTPPK